MTHFKIKFFSLFHLCQHHQISTWLLDNAGTRYMLSLNLFYQHIQQKLQDMNESLQEEMQLGFQTEVFIFQLIWRKADVIVFLFLFPIVEDCVSNCRCGVWTVWWIIFIFVMMVTLSLTQHQSGTNTSIIHIHGIYWVNCFLLSNTIPVMCVVCLLSP